MAKSLMILLMVMMCIGCASQKPKYVTKIETITVYKPVYTPPQSIQNLTPIERPDLKTNYLSEADKKDPGKVAKAILESEAQLRNYAEQLENQNNVLMEIYKRPADPIPPPTRVIEMINSK